MLVVAAASRDFWISRLERLHTYQVALRETVPGLKNRNRAASVLSPIIIVGMHPNVGCDLTLFRELGPGPTSSLGQMRKTQYEQMFSAVPPITDILSGAFGPAQLKPGGSFHSKSNNLRTPPFCLAKRSSLIYGS